MSIFCIFFWIMGLFKLGSQGEKHVFVLLFCFVPLQKSKNKMEWNLPPLDCTTGHGTVERFYNRGSNVVLLRGPVGHVYLLLPHPLVFHCQIRHICPKVIFRFACWDKVFENNFVDFWAKNVFMAFAINLHVQNLIFAPKIDITLTWCFTLQKSVI